MNENVKEREWPILLGCSIVYCRSVFLELKGKM